MPRAPALVLCTLLATLAPAHAEVLFIGPDSRASFSVRLLLVNPLRGQFTHVYGNLYWSPTRHAGVVRAWIDVRSAHMPKARYRQLLLGPEFLDAARYPRIAFRSDAITAHTLRAGGNIRGQLTLHGVTRPVAFTLQPANCTRPGSKPCTLRLHGVVKRKHFGMRAHGVVLSNKVRLHLVVQLPAATHR